MAVGMISCYVTAQHVLVSVFTVVGFSVYRKLYSQMCFTVASDFKVCASSPCANGGTCRGISSKPSEYTCECAAGFDGKTCQSENSIIVIVSGQHLLLVLVKYHPE